MSETFKSQALEANLAQTRNLDRKVAEAQTKKVINTLTAQK